MTLDEWAVEFGTDKSSKGHDYCRWYDHHLDYLRVEPGVVLCEIGVFTGASMRMWALWLPQASIVGIDLDLSRVASPQDMPVNVRLVREDATKMTLPEHSVDVLIDDGSHQARDVADTLTRHWQAVRPGGWLITEDWATQWEPYYGGSSSGSKATDAAHRWLDRALMPQTDNVAELHAYTELLLIRKAG